MKLHELIIAEGVDGIIAKAFCRGLGQHRPKFITDYKVDHKRWLNRVKAEEMMFARVGMFSSDDRYVHYMHKHKRLIYVFYMDLLKKLYGDDYAAIADHARAQFKNQVKKNLRKWAAAIFAWDPYWIVDPDLGPFLL